MELKLNILILSKIIGISLVFYIFIFVFFDILSGKKLINLAN